jgi:hypothetical protein
VPISVNGSAAADVRPVYLNGSSKVMALRPATAATATIQNRHATIAGWRGQSTVVASTRLPVLLDADSQTASRSEG